MAKISEFNPELIELFRGKLDIYMYKGKIPVVRKWPKKIKPPYTPLQAEAQAVFSLANSSMKYLDYSIILEWRKLATGKRPSWTDVYRKIIMRYWRDTKTITPIAKNVTVTKEGDNYLVKWTIIKYESYTQKEPTSEELKAVTIPKDQIEGKSTPVYVTLFNDDGYRACAPYINMKEYV